MLSKYDNKLLAVFMHSEGYITIMIYFRQNNSHQVKIALLREEKHGYVLSVYITFYYYIHK